MKVDLTAPQLKALIDAAEAAMAGDGDGDVPGSIWPQLRRGTDKLKYALLQRPPVLRGPTASDGELVTVLKMALRLFDEALPKFNWAASALDANAIHLLNAVPLAVRRVLAKEKR